VSIAGECMTAALQGSGRHLQESGHGQAALGSSDTRTNMTPDWWDLPSFNSYSPPSKEGLQKQVIGSQVGIHDCG
jgi:hypothetical protein